MRESDRLWAEADALMDKSHEAEEAGMKDLAAMYAEQSKAKYKEAEDAERQGN